MPPVSEAPLTPTAYRRRRRNRRIAVAALALVILLAVTALAARLWLRHAILAGTPQLDGTLHVAGLSAPVTVRRDSYGIPHIQATTEDDLLIAQGYVTAQDRLWQMDMLRRHSSGELAEILGSGLLEHDRTERYLQLRAVADRSVGTLDPSELHALQQYAKGVNAAIAAAGTGSASLPAEFRLLGYTPRPWTPRDSLLVGFAMAEDLSTGYPEKLNREAISAHLSPEMAADLYPVNSFRDHPPAEGHKDLSTPREMIEIPLDDSQVQLNKPRLEPGHLQDLVQADAVLAESVSALRCDGCAAGSNNWVVSGARSASGKPMVANDMHLTISVPGIWYTAALDAPGLSAAGVTLPGVPYVIVGHNREVAWGFTNSTADAQDLYVEQRTGTGPGRDTYTAADGSSQPFEHRTEIIHVHHGLDTKLDIAFTRHGAALTPILTPLFPHEHRTLALRWTLYEPGFASMPFGRANRASTGAELEAAFDHFGGPSQNLVWGDIGGHIGYHLIGWVPLRNAPATNSTSPAITAPPLNSATSEDTSGAPRPDLRTWVIPSATIGNNSLPVPSAPTTSSRTTALPPPTTALPTAFIPIGGQHALAPIPVPAGEYEWTQMIPYDQLPRVTDPASGILATANARITADSYPYPISLDWESPYRNERIWRALGDRTGLTAASMTGLQDDVFSALDQTLGQRVAYAVDHTKSASKRDREAANLLRAWDGRVTLDAPQPNITQAVRDALLSMLLEPRIGPDAVTLYTPHARAYALEMLVENAQPRWLPAGYTDWNTLLTAALERGLKDAKAPGKLGSWHWSQKNGITLAHPVFGKTWYLRWLSGEQSAHAPLPGNGYTVRAAYGLHGASQRFVVDLATPFQATMTLPMGESGNMASAHFADQFSAWSTGRPLPMTESSSSHRLTLAP